MRDARHEFESDTEIGALVSAFESCSFHPSQFKHYQHLAVALWYVSRLPYDKAVERMRNGIRKLASTYGKTGYHETITLFWLRLVKGFLAHTEPPYSIAALANQLAAKYGDKKLIDEYYSTAALTSPKAKTEWVEPDLKPIDFAQERTPDAVQSHQ